MSRSPDYLGLLEALGRHGVAFIVVGGVAAVLEGVPITTLDLDVVYDRRPENLERLATALRSLDARYRDPVGRDIRPDVERLRTLRMSLLDTGLGPLDVIAEVGEGWAYDELLPATVVQQVAEIQVRSLTLSKLIELKEMADRDKDRAMLPVLKRTLEMQKKE